MWHTPRFPGRILVSLRDRGPTGSRRFSHRRRSAVFRLEHLEDRTLLSNFTVSNLADSGDGSLRAAVLAADADPGSTIDFAPGLHGTIALSKTNGELDITSNMTINGPAPPCWPSAAAMPRGYLPSPRVSRPKSTA